MLLDIPNLVGWLVGWVLLMGPESSLEFQIKRWNFITYHTINNESWLLEHYRRSYDAEKFINRSLDCNFKAHKVHKYRHFSFTKLDKLLESYSHLIFSLTLG